LDLSLTPDQDAVRELFARFYAKESSPARVREAEATGFDQRLWRSLEQMGAPSMGVPEAAGGGGAGIADLAIVAEQHGAHLGSAPLIEAMVASRVLGRTDAGLPTLALRPAVAGIAKLVPGGAVADSVIAKDGDDLVAVRQAAEPLRRRSLGSASLADVVVTGDRDVLATGPDARRIYDAALDEWRVLSSAALVGLARAALSIGVQYVKDRHQFGVPIGSFQTVQHRLADLQTAVDGAALLSAKAAWAADEGEPDASALAAMAYIFCGRTAEQAAAASLHYHGGYGFMLEYDIQLYVRRSKAWRLVLGDPRRELQVLADRLYA
jgi:alkylation response protein AidB-like acyl-CoA dehydrogenase